MKINLQGCTRIVFIFRRVVIKIPKPFIWSHFLSGLIANMNEDKCWKWNSGKYEKGSSHLLCPVVWASWGGWLLIMKRANTEEFKSSLHSKLVIIHEELYKPWVDAGFSGDDKIDNYGIFKGNVVKIDYGS